MKKYIKTIEEAIEAFKPINKGIKVFRKEYKVPKRARDKWIINTMLRKDFKIFVPMNNIKMGGVHKRGKFLHLLGLILNKAYLSGVMDTLKIQEAEKK